MRNNDLFTGIWHENLNASKKIEFTDGGQYWILREGKPYAITVVDGVEKLTIGNSPKQSAYDRKEDSPVSGIAGVWSNEAEEIYFTAKDYYWNSLAEPLQIERGTYESIGDNNGGIITTRDLRSIFTINENNIVFTPAWGVADPGTYVFSNDNNTLTIDLASGSQSFHRIT
ncbi:hypothetical protein D8Y20_07235 [Mariprofundus sp. EBB-1]|uniref:hypothetical protein n=1 Tax=Mariprofundus sp. EBB-1 TaxID=2650971 RepID=UPI000EF1C7E9|nr:hypothetical protein [Mariprofundus sp. EBB-1]RLL52299.1 hypothetical protein D8Y20_07235 [Mariprofundus sp. EBB-1]